MRFRNILLLFIPVLLFTACNKFLDVKPKTQIDTDEAFNDEQGFMDALTGVYLKMNDNAVYGKELSFGLTEVLSMQHSRFTNTFHEYYYASQYNYTNAAVRSKIDGIWKGLYNAIANDNNLISNLNTTNKGMFRDVNYDIIRGEAYGLRAFLHFDLLRLFAPAPASAGGLTAKAIPYMDQLTVNALPRLTVQEILNRILADCAIAEAALKTTDPIVPGSTTPTTTTGYLRDRFYKFNYFAVKALEARVYLYMGDNANALAAAEEVINANAFTWVNIPQISTGNQVFTSELIFTLYKSDMTPFTEAYFSAAASNVLTKASDDEFQAIYETTEDIRYTLLTQLDNTSTNLRLSTKLAQPAGVSTSYLRRMPIMRLSEMYYIAAEALKQSDPEKAITYLNTVRRSRNVLTDLPVTLTTEQIQEELFKEYRKDLYCEGQLFFYYKRLNLPSIAYTSVKADNAVYVLPLPDNEVEYGNGN